MAITYEVRVVESGPEKGKWGVYVNGDLQIAFVRKSDATSNMKRRKRRETQR